MKNRMLREKTMIMTLFVCLAGSSAWNCSAADKGSSNSNEKRSLLNSLQGKWVSTRFQLLGMWFPPKPSVRNEVNVPVFRGNEWLYSDENSKEILYYKFELDETKSPAHITLSVADEIVVGIIEFKNDELFISLDMNNVAGSVDKESLRPKDFDTDPWREGFVTCVYKKIIDK